MTNRLEKKLAVYKVCNETFLEKRVIKLDPNDSD